MDILNSLRGWAKRDTVMSEFSPDEHIAGIAATEIERLTAANQNLGKQLQDVEMAMNNETSKRLTVTTEVIDYEQLVSELYQVCGSLLGDAGAFETEHGERLMDRLMGESTESLLPWPAFRDDDGTPLSAASSKHDPHE